jgi:hypothetical protein
MGKTSTEDKDLDETKRIMERLVKTPPDPHGKGGAAPNPAPRPKVLVEKDRKSRNKPKDRS